MLYKLDFTVEYDHQLGQHGLFAVWAEEADAALGARKAGEDFAKDVKERLGL